MKILTRRVPLRNSSTSEKSLAEETLLRRLGSYLWKRLVYEGTADNSFFLIHNPTPNESKK